MACAGLAGAGGVSGALAGEAPALALPRFERFDDAPFDERRPFPRTGSNAKVTLLHFFATWCAPCREELPSLDRLATRAADRGVAIVAYAVADTEGALQRFRARHAIHLEARLDADRAVARSWGVSTLPTTIVLDAASTPRLIAAEAADWDGVDLDHLLRAIADADAKPRANSSLSGDK